MKGGLKGGTGNQGRICSGQVQSCVDAEENMEIWLKKIKMIVEKTNIIRSEVGTRQFDVLSITPMIFFFHLIFNIRETSKLV